MDDRNDDSPAKAEEASQRVKDAAGAAVHDIKSAAGSALKDAQGIAMKGVEETRAKAGDMGHTTASRFRDLATQMETDMPWLSGAFTKSADGLDSVTNSLTGGNVGDTLNGLSDFARRQPAIFLGASVALGFALARIGKTALEEAVPAPQPETPAAKSFDSASEPYPRPTGV